MYRARFGLSTQLYVLDVDSLPSEQMEENAISFWCKNGDKNGPLYLQLMKTHFQALPIINIMNTQLFKGNRKDMKSRKWRE